MGSIFEFDKQFIQKSKCAKNIAKEIFKRTMHKILTLKGIKIDYKITESKRLWKQYKN